MSHDRPNPEADKVPRPLSSERIQQGDASPDPVLERPDPDTEAVDKVITPSSTKELEQQTREIHERLDKVERKTP